MKTVLEWSLGFDLMWNNITSNQAPGLTEHEKSVFLTQAQENLVKDYFSHKSNSLLEGFDDSRRRQSDFVSLIESTVLQPDAGSEHFVPASRAKYFKYPANAFIILNEQFVVNDDKYLVVNPISYEEYARLMMKPYKFPAKGQVWRLNTGTAGSGSSEYQKSEVIGRFAQDDTIEYSVRYVKRPEPIILPDMQGSPSSTVELPVNGSTDVATCKLPEHLHDEIMLRAVQIAKVTWTDGATLANAAQRGE